jgi:PadR family transcriptional regulator
MGGLDEWLPPAYLGLRLGGGYRNRLTDRAGLYSRCSISGRKPVALDKQRISSYTGSVPTVDTQREHLEFLQGTLEVLILRSLQLAPNHAYGISQFLEQQSENEFLVDNGSLYPALQRLLQRQWIAAQWKTSPNGRRAKYYRLTPLGRKQLSAATSKWLRFVEAMGRILAPEG